MEFIAIPIMILNFASGIFGGIWLAFLGNWHVVFIGLLLTLVGAFLVSLLLLPSMMFLAPVLASEKLANSAMAMLPLAILSVGYTYCVMGLWAIGIFWYFSVNVDSSAAIQSVFWSYLAKKDVQSGNQFSSMSSFFHQIGCISLMIYTYNNFHRLDLYAMAIWFAVPMSIGLILQVMMMASTIRAERH